MKKRMNNRIARYTPALIIFFAIAACFIVNGVALAEDKKKVIEIPVREYNRLSKDMAESVIIDIDKYNSILLKIDAQKQKAESPDSVNIVNADYNIEYTDKTISGKAELRLRILKTGWLPLAGYESTLLRNSLGLKIDGRDARYMVNSGKYYFYAERKGYHVLRFRFFPKPSERRSLRVRLIPGLRTTASISLPGDDLELKAPGMVITGVAVKDGSTRVKLIAPKPDLYLAWKAKEKEPFPGQEAPLKAVADVSSVYMPDNKRVASLHLLALQVLKGRLNKISILLPDGLSVLDVTGEKIARYKTVKIGNISKLEIEIEGDISEDIVLLINAESGLKESSILLHPLYVGEVQRQTGMIAVRPLEPAFFVGKENTDYSKLDPREMPPTLRQLSGGELSLGYSYNIPAGSRLSGIEIGVQFQPAADVLQAYIEKAKVTTLLTSDGRALSRLEYRFVSSGAQFMRLMFAKGQLPLSVFVNGKPVPAVKEEETLIIPVKTAGRVKACSVEVTLLGTIAGFGEEGNLTVTLPALKAPLRLLEWNFYLPWEYDYSEFGGNVSQGRIAVLPELILSRPDAQVIMKGARRDGKAKRKTSLRLYDALEAAKPPMEGAISSRAVSPAPPVDMTSSSLSMRIAVPTIGIKKVFHSLLIINEVPKLTFEYEER